MKAAKTSSWKLLGYSEFLVLTATPEMMVNSGSAEKKEIVGATYRTIFIIYQPPSCLSFTLLYSTNLCKISGQSLNMGAKRQKKFQLFVAI